jgi:molybdopterin-guanine dinucleotide biosynthesis protein A
MLAAPRSYEALVPRFPLPGRPLAASPQPHPLHAVYSRACLPVLRRALDDGMRRSTDFLALIHTVYIEPPDIARYDPSGYSFLNINTPADLAWFQQYSGR